MIHCKLNRLASQTGVAIAVFIILTGTLYKRVDMLCEKSLVDGCTCFSREREALAQNPSHLPMF